MTFSRAEKLQNERPALAAANASVAAPAFSASFSSVPMRRHKSRWLQPTTG
jgi:hypothetical protein